MPHGVPCRLNQAALAHHFGDPTVALTDFADNQLAPMQL